MSAIIEYQKLKGLTPDGDIGKKTLAVIQADCNIKSDIELSHFMGQCHHETGGFKASSENLNYSAEGLMKVFPKYFPNMLTAEKYERKPEMIASRVYASRMGNGDELSKDGWTYRGRGAIQLTGKNNYKAFGIAIEDADVMTNPSKVATEYFFKSADFFFDTNNLWSIAKKGITADVIKELTKRVNGGYNGLTDRIEHTKHYYSILTK